MSLHFQNSSFFDLIWLSRLPMVARAIKSPYWGYLMTKILVNKSGFANEWGYSNLEMFYFLFKSLVSEILLFKSFVSEIDIFFETNLIILLNLLMIFLIRVRWACRRALNKSWKTKVWKNDVWYVFGWTCSLYYERLLRTWLAFHQKWVINSREER